MRNKGYNHRALYILLLVLSCHGVTAQLDTEDAILEVYMDTGMIHGQRLSMGEVVKKAGTEASSQMEKGSLSVRILTSLEKVVGENLTAVLTITDCNQLQLLAPEIADAERLHIAITEAGCKRIRSPSTMTIPLVEGQNDMVQLIADLREKNTLIWSDIIVIHDGTLDSHEMDLVMNRLRLPTDHAPQTSVITIDISKAETASVILGTLFSELGPRPGEPRERQFLAIVARDQVEKVQNLANIMNLMGPKYQWLYVIPDSHSLNYDMLAYLGNMKDGDNVAFVYNMSELNPGKKDCKNDVSCYLDTLIRQYALEYSRELKNELQTYYQVSEEEWKEIKPSQSTRAERVINAIKHKQEIMPSCAICTRWGIQAAEISAADRIELLNVADWLPATGLLLMDDIFPHITGGFRKRVISVTSVHYPPWQIFERNGNYSGLIFEVVKTLGERLNFSFVVRPPPDGKWGTRTPSGVWNGMIEMVRKKEVLFGAAAFTVSNERLAVVNFIQTIDHQPYTFMIARPKELSRVFIFIKPFTSNIWVYIGITVLIMGPILFLINRYSPYYTFYGLYDGRGLFRLDNCSWYIYGAIVQQGGKKLPQSNSGRLVVVSWWIFVIVVVTTYSGNLVAFLTFPQIENVVSSLDDLLKHKDEVTWGFTNGTVLDEYFKESEGKFKKIGGLAERHDAQNNALFDQIRYNSHAFLEWKTNLLFIMKEQYLKTDKCDFSLGREEFYYERVAMPVPKDSPYIEIFDKEIKRMQLGGLIEKWKQNFWPKKDKCSSTAYGGSGETRTVSLLDMQGSFFILLMGFLLSLVTMIIECIFQRNIRSLPSTPSSTQTLVRSFLA